MGNIRILKQPCDRSALVLYGSETGNSEDVAYQLSNILERLHFTTRVSEMNFIHINDLLKFSIVLLTVSTTGQGEFPKNAQIFWKSLLRKSLSKDYLNHVLFTTFGLGDSSYAQFNYSARKLHKRLLQLGAIEIFPAGEADDRHPEGIDGTYLTWSHQLREHLLKTLPLPKGLSPISLDVLLSPKHHLEIDHELLLVNSLVQKFQSHEVESIPDSTIKTGTDLKSSDIQSKRIIEVGKSSKPRLETHDHVAYKDLNEAHIGIDYPSGNEHIHLPNGYRASLKSNIRMTPDAHFQDVRELTFTIKNSISYEPGDSIIIYPKNKLDAVERLIDMMDWQTVADIPLKFQPDHPSYHGDEWLITAVPRLYPIPHSTLRQLLINNMDINSIPKRRFFEVIAHYTENSTHRERLLEFANPLFTDEFYDYTTRPRRSILEVLEDFSSVRLPWQHITSIFPVIHGRAYSIASGGIQKDEVTKSSKFTTITILIAVVKYKTILRKIRQGLCSRYLASLEVGTTIEIEIHKSKSFYKLARTDPQFPLILIGPGTGIAPCRSLILERRDFQSNLDGSEKEFHVGNHYLFFGGRNRRADFFYEEDWKKESMKTVVFTAFSRDQREKIYVQDIIAQQNELICNLILKHGAIIYVCGSSGNMPKAVKEAFISALISYHLSSNKAPISRDIALQKLDEMVKTGRYVQETW
ncbi:NADPH-dependent diflavin oxidoreductase 1 [Erysiphe neolycopersici]|uniref:NADPH-dependent diflavin oxidoreductase 1 n=1 Tax=Erysiphe neolycopersici TaxID=212602 RepID=A0A420HVJ9_9PEZI|nr:NADPH-dependent diflavin oxidoreductase 1 [Erysiphe neolycopersici]